MSTKNILITALWAFIVGIHLYVTYHQVVDHDKPIPAGNLKSAQTFLE